MSVGICQVLGFAALLVVCGRPARAQAGMAMGLLAVTADTSAAPEAATPLPTTKDTLEAVDRIIALWPELAGKLPADEPRYNWEDIGHIAFSTGSNTIVRSVMAGRMVSGMKKCGIKVPDDALSARPRPVDKDNNGGVKRNVTRAQLEQLQEDTDMVRTYMESVASKFGKKLPVNDQGLSVKDWERIKTLLKGLSWVSK